MNWEMISAIGEVMGAAAVLVTLAYLALQVRQNTASIQASVRQAIVENDQQFLFRIMDDPELTLLRYKPDLTDEEKIRLSMYLIAIFRMRENLWRQHQEGVLDDATWKSYRSSIAAFASPRVSNWLANDAVARQFDPGFIAMVRDIIANTPVSDRPIWLSVFD